VGTGNQLAGHGKRTLLVVFVATGRTETAFATEWDKFKFTTVRTSKHGTTMGRVAAVNHLFDIFNLGFAGM